MHRCLGATVLSVSVLLPSLTWAQHAMPAGMGHDEHLAQMKKEAELKRRGAAAMGFDQDTAAHHFRLLPDGGVIEVEVKNPRDDRARQQVRRHLQQITDEFSRGVFGRPFETHAEVPPGVPAMKTLRDRIRYGFEATERGGRVRITTTSADALAGVHAFLRYQIREHGTGDPQ